MILGVFENVSVRRVVKPVASAPPLLVVGGLFVAAAFWAGPQKSGLDGRADKLPPPR